MTPDFESAKGYYWMKQISALEREGTPLKQWPRKKVTSLADRSFYEQVHRRLSRQSYTMGVSFDKDGRLIREE